MYDAYTAADEDLLPVLNRLFWQDYDDENDGVYSALSRIREVLKAQVRYSETAEAAPDNADPIAYFLTDPRKGNAVLYASATVQALRAHGIPARYTEGYYLPIAKTQSSADGTAALTGQDAHAWAEVYFDGIGWLPVDATPGYYFDAVALQQMVSLPDTVRKTAAIDEDRSGADQVVEPSGTGGSEQSKPLTVVKNVAAVGFGIASTVILLFVQRLWGRNVKKSWKMRLKLRYACLLAAK